jgi:hypothetical protein
MSLEILTDINRLLSCSRFSSAEKIGGTPGEGSLSKIMWSERRNVSLLWNEAFAIRRRPKKRVLLWALPPTSAS